MSTVSVIRIGSAGRQPGSHSQASAQGARRGGWARVARAALRALQQALGAWCGSEMEQGESDPFTDERARAITSLAMSGDAPFGG